MPHFAPLGRVTTRLKLIQILGFVPWQVVPLSLWVRSRSLRDTWADADNPSQQLMLTMLGGLAEFERELIRSRQ